MGDTRTPIDPQGYHGLQHVLGINGVQSNPDRVNLDSITPVIDMNMRGDARIHDPDNIRFVNAAYTFLSFRANYVTNIISYGNTSSANNLDLAYSLNHCFRTIAMTYQVHVQPDVAHPDDIMYRTFRVKISLLWNALEYDFWSADHSIIDNSTGGRFARYFNYPGDWGTIHDEAVGPLVTNTRYTGLGSRNRIEVPVLTPGMQVRISFVPNCLPFGDASYWEFPTGSQIYIRVIGLQVPIGAPIPSFY